MTTYHIDVCLFEIVLKEVIDIDYIYTLPGNKPTVKLLVGISIIFWLTLV